MPGAAVLRQDAAPRVWCSIARMLQHRRRHSVAVPRAVEPPVPRMVHRVPFLRRREGKRHGPRRDVLGSDSVERC